MITRPLPLLRAALCASAVLVCCAAPAAFGAAAAVTKKIDLLQLTRAGQVDYHINPKADIAGDPKSVFTFTKENWLRISGEGYGYIATRESHRDYHLVIEFKWGAKTWGRRVDRARDSGILVHAYGPHGAHSGNWMASIEAQIIEGGTGDILVLSPKLPDGTQLLTSLTCEFGLDRDKEKIWRPGSPRQVVTTGRVNWLHRDEDWTDTVGYRGKKDVESPLFQWSRLEVIARGDTLKYYLNGVLVNEGFDAKPSEGKVLVQTEAAEMFVRRYELHPLGAFKEKWTAANAK
ncbi:MAG: DUF1080 domain-containing protein [Opitutaceae bacterium]|nr:DUF1080 domain-containing protein [Opitutaceae bacterium]